MATTSETQIANIGLSRTIVKFIEKYVALGNIEGVSGVIQTAIITVSIFSGLILLCGYPLARWLLGIIVPNNSLILVLDILPYAFFALWLVLITSIFQGGLDGYQRIDPRNYLLIDRWCYSSSFAMRFHGNNIWAHGVGLRPHITEFHNTYYQLFFHQSICSFASIFFIQMGKKYF